MLETLSRDRRQGIWNGCVSSNSGITNVNINIIICVNIVINITTIGMSPSRIREYYVVLTDL